MNQQRQVATIGFDEVVQQAITSAFNKGYRSCIEALKEAQQLFPQLSAKQLIDWADRIIQADNE